MVCTRAQAGVAGGACEDGVHVFWVRVYYEDTDAAGIVYYANYLKFAERARSEMLRQAGIDHVAVLAEWGAAFAVRECTAEFLKPARLDDLLAVHTRLVEVKGASLRAEQTVRRGDAELVRLRLRLACMTVAGRPVRLPKAVRASLETMCITEQRA